MNKDRLKTGHVPKAHMYKGPPSKRFAGGGKPSGLRCLSVFKEQSDRRGCAMATFLPLSFSIFFHKHCEVEEAEIQRLGKNNLSNKRAV